MAPITSRIGVALTIGDGDAAIRLISNHRLNIMAALKAAGAEAWTSLHCQASIHIGHEARHKRNRNDHGESTRQLALKALLLEEVGKHIS
jgi:hypothetical protein